MKKYEARNHSKDNIIIYTRKYGENIDTHTHTHINTLINIHEP